MGIQENLKSILQSIPEGVKLVAVSKTKPNEDILKAYQFGHKIFGENKAQELISKQPQLPGDIEWHFIGHLQRNKVKYLVPFVKLIHGVDSFRLLREINKEATKEDRIIDCLLQFHIAMEETKFGLDLSEAREILGSEDYLSFNNVRIRGVMGMATFTENESQIRKEFKNLRQIFEDLKKEYFQEELHFNEISAGMSNDYQIAIDEGSTIIRVGSDIFGERNYN